MLQAMSDSFWKQKRARLQAELAQQLAELDEFEARERALQEVASGAPAPALAASSDVVALQAALEAERARNAALEEQLAKSAAAAEVNLQKVSSFWIAKLEEAKGQAVLPAAAEAAPAAAAGAELVPVEKEFLEESLTVRELRARLLSYGLSTIGVKSELRTRLEGAMAHSRHQYKSWDSATLTWN